MAEYRTLHTKLWQDEWVCELKPDAKLLFIYLVTNRAASVAGIYKLPVKFIAFETGIEPARVLKLLGEFQKAGKVYHENGVIWVKRLRAYQTYHGKATPQVQSRIDRDLADIPDCALKHAYLDFYATGLDPAIPTAYPSDTPGIPTPETETETDTETETTLVGGSAPTSAPEPDPVKELAVIFEQAAGIKRPEPTTKSGRETVGVTWWKPLREMVQMANGSAAGRLQEAVTKMRRDDLTIKAPASVLSVFTSLDGKAKTSASPSRPAIDPQNLTPEQQELKARLNAKRREVANANP